VFVLWIGLAPGTFLRPAAVAVQRATAAPAAAFTARMQADSTGTAVQASTP